MPKSKKNMTERQLDALAKLYRTKGGRKIIAECREGILLCLMEGVGKP